MGDLERNPAVGSLETDTGSQRASHAERYLLLLTVRTTIRRIKFPLGDFCAVPGGTGNFSSEAGWRQIPPYGNLTHEPCVLALGRMRMQLSFLTDRETEADWEPEVLELPLVEPWPRPGATTIDIDSREPERGSRVIVIDLA